MSKNKKKGRLSRRLRKLRGIGKKAILGVASVETQKHQPAPSKEVLNNNEVTFTEIPSTPEDTGFVSFDEAKSKEIRRNLRTVMTVSVGCLIILGILYYFESQNDWVSLVNTDISEFMTGWSWSF